MSGFPSVYGYRDYRAYLRDWLAACEAQGSLSGRGLADRAQRSPAYLPNVLAGRFQMTVDAAHAYAKAMGLDQGERGFLVLLVRHAREKSAAGRDAMAREILRRQAGEVACRDSELFVYLDDWVNIAVREALALPDARPDPAWLAERCVPRVPPAVVEQALILLENLEFIAPDPAQPSRWRPTDAGLKFDKPSVNRAAVRAYHRAMLHRAADSVWLGRGEKALDSRSIAISRDRVPELKARLKALLDELCDNAPDEAPADAVYHVQVALFPLFADPPLDLPAEMLGEEEP
ncbi:MAG: TIGR02147 family protein [Myxococcales bacterium]|nr:TIGR02147 family protein [Myxococcales bacterium]MCB9526249.1 TIGR02147 family protein [Myxococcales bacterium]